MITRLKIKNLALIKDITLEFNQGFNLLMGETGAGKSIILDALNFALGSKSDKSLISHGTEIMKVEACFENYGQAVKDILNDLSIEDEGLIIISRSLTIEGKSDIKINGNTATLNMLKLLSIHLADSYSQHENLLLLKDKNHLSILDVYAGDVLNENKSILKDLLAKRSDILNQIQQLGGDDVSRQRELEFIKYQIDEITDLNPTVEEEQQLTEKLNILASSEKIISALDQAYSNLNQNLSALNQIKIAEKSLLSISNISTAYLDLATRLTNSYYELDDIALSIKHELNNVYYDEKELDRVDTKLDKYKNLKRKYGNTVEDVLKNLQILTQKFDNISNSDEIISKLNKEQKNIEEKIEEVCANLNAQRKIASNNLEKALKTEFADLGMKNAEFKVKFNKTTYSSNGFDDVQFLFSANLGEELKPLSKIISGGEMSRFMLAFKNINIQDNSTMIFDEIDTGISGDIGSAVAKKIANISKFNQVICISHLPQVCVMADKYFYVSKSVVENKTESKVVLLDEDNIAIYIAKLTGGREEVTNEAITFANQLLSWAKEYKNQLKNL